VASSLTDSCCLCHVTSLYHQLMMTSLARLQATAVTSWRPRQPLPGSACHSSSGTCPWIIDLYRGAAADQRNSLIDPSHRLLLRVDTLPPPNADQLDKVSVVHYQRFFSVSRLRSHTTSTETSLLVQYSTIVVRYEIVFGTYKKFEKKQRSTVKSK